MNSENAKFVKFYREVAVTQNYIQPSYARMDNWAVDLYECREKFAGMMDSGYYRYIGEKDGNGKVVWRVSESYGPSGYKYEFSGITEEEFESRSF